MKTREGVRLTIVTLGLMKSRRLWGNVTGQRVEATGSKLEDTKESLSIQIPPSVFGDKEPLFSGCGEGTSH